MYEACPVCRSTKRQEVRPGLFECLGRRAVDRTGIPGTVPERVFVVCANRYPAVPGPCALKYPDLVEATDPIERLLRAVGHCERYMRAYSVDGVGGQSIGDFHGDPCLEKLCPELPKSERSSWWTGTPSYGTKTLGTGLSAQVGAWFADRARIMGVPMNGHSVARGGLFGRKEIRTPCWTFSGYGGELKMDANGVFQNHSENLNLYGCRQMAFLLGLAEGP